MHFRKAFDVVAPNGGGISAACGTAETGGVSYHLLPQRPHWLSAGQESLIHIVFGAVGKLFYPMQLVRTRGDSIARQWLRAPNWSMTDTINMQPEDKGGIDMILPSQYRL